MGQSHSRRSSTASDTPLNRTATHDSTLEKTYEAFYGTGNSFFAENASSNPNLAQSITQPAPPPRLHRYSELIDPADLLGLIPEDASIVSVSSIYSQSYSSRVKQSNRPHINYNKRLPPLIQSPSGGTLAPQEFLARKDRPLAIRERQEGIRSAIRRAEKNGSLGNEVGKLGNVSNVSIGSLGAFERSKVEEGRRAYEEKMKMKKAKGGKGVKSHLLCGCFGSRDDE